MQYGASLQLHFRESKYWRVMRCSTPCSIDHGLQVLKCIQLLSPLDESSLASHSCIRDILAIIRIRGRSCERVETHRLFGTQLSIAVPSSSSIPLIAKLRTSSSMVDEPITDLGHTYTSCLSDVNRKSTGLTRIYSHLRIWLFVLRSDMDWRCSVVESV